LYESAERDAIILTKKNERIFGLERRLKDMEKKINEFKQRGKGGDNKKSEKINITERIN
jgi:hypothetical protein